MLMVIGLNFGPAVGDKMLAVLGPPLVELELFQEAMGGQVDLMERQVIVGLTLKMQIIFYHGTVDLLFGQGFFHLISEINSAAR